MIFLLAPLAGFTDAPFRKMCADGGADGTYTEMVSAAALAHGNVPTRLMLEKMEGEGPLACQIFGASECDVAAAAREIEKVADRFVELNLNAGCPMQKIVDSGCGGRLVEDPPKVYRLLKAMKENTSLPVTLKTRLGMHRATPAIMELLDAAESAGAAKIIVHARSVGQKHGGPLNLELLAEVAARARIPVIGNGSVKTTDDVAAMAAAGVAGVMIGRAALAEPTVFARLSGRPCGKIPGPAETAVRHLDLVLDFYACLAARFPEAHVPDADGIASIKMHTHLFRYFSGMPGAVKLRSRLSSIRTLAEVRDAMAPFAAATGDAARTAQPAAPQN